MIKLFGDDPKEDLIKRVRAMTVYGYYDGPTLFTAQVDDDPHQIYLFRWTMVGDEEQDLLDNRVYKADGFEITTKESEVDWDDAELGR